MELSLGHNPFEETEEVEDNDSVNMDVISPNKQHLKQLAEKMDEGNATPEEKQKKVEENYKKSITTNILEEFETTQVKTTPEKVYRVKSQSTGPANLQQSGSQLNQTNPETVKQSNDSTNDATNDAANGARWNIKQESIETNYKIEQKGKRAIQEMDALKGMGNQRFKVGDLSTALSIYENGVKVADIFLGESTEEAMNEFKLSPEAVTAITQKGNTLGKLFAPESATMFPKLEELKNDFPDQENEINTMLSVFSEIIPTMYDVLVKLLNNVGTVHMKSSNIEQAKQNLQRVLLLDERCVKALLRLSMCYEQEKDLERASEYVSKAIELEPNSTLAQDRLNSITLQMNKKLSTTVPSKQKPLSSKLASGATPSWVVPTSIVALTSLTIGAGALVFKRQISSFLSRLFSKNKK